MAAQSTLEADRFLILLERQQQGEITDLARAPRLELSPAFVDVAGVRWRAIHYTPDFTWTEGGRRVYEEVKPAARRTTSLVVGLDGTPRAIVKTSKAPSAARRDWVVRMAWAARRYPEAEFRVWTGG